MIQPEFDNHHDLKVDVDVLNFLSLVVGVDILDLFSADVVELAYLIKGIHTYFLKPFALLLFIQKP